MSLLVSLERALPATLPVGRSTAVFCVGACFHPLERIQQLEIVVQGVAYPPAAFGMPRPDLGAGAWSESDPGGHRYHSGFWGTVPVPACERPGTIELRVSARLADGAEASCLLGEIEVGPDEASPAIEPPPAVEGSVPGLIAVCMATYEPEMALFAAQVESLRAQTDDRWVCLISDDCSSPEHFERVVEAVADDPRFAISRSDERLGFYRNFERALRIVPPEAELVALCDQDDRWHPDKLRVLRESQNEAVLVYSDQRLVEADGTLLRDTLWSGRRNNYDNLASMLIANTITGAAALFRRELLETALPFPDTPGFQFHDHWLAVVALATGDVAYVDRPLYDYVQHAGAVFGDVTHGLRSGPESGRRGIGRFRGRFRHSSWRAAYFYGYLAREAQAQTLLTRCDGRLTVRKRRALELLIACNSSTPALVWLAARTLRIFVGRTETLGTEIELAQGIVWKRLTQAFARRRRHPGGLFSDGSIPPPQSFSHKRLRRWRARLKARVPVWRRIRRCQCRTSSTRFSEPRSGSRTTGS